MIDFWEISSENAVDFLPFVPTFLTQIMHGDVSIEPKSRQIPWRNTSLLHINSVQNHSQKRKASSTMEAEQPAWESPLTNNCFIRSVHLFKIANLRKGWNIFCAKQEYFPNAFLYD